MSFYHFKEHNYYVHCTILCIYLPYFIFFVYTCICTMWVNARLHSNFTCWTLHSFIVITYLLGCNPGWALNSSQHLAMTNLFIHNFIMSPSTRHQIWYLSKYLSCKVWNWGFFIAQTVRFKWYLICWHVFSSCWFTAKMKANIQTHILRR